jgi:hypothetical protein
MKYILCSFGTFFWFWYHVPRKIRQPCCRECNLQFKPKYCDFVRIAQICVNYLTQDFDPFGNWQSRKLQHCYNPALTVQYWDKARALADQRSVFLAPQYIVVRKIVSRINCGFFNCRAINCRPKNCRFHSMSLLKIPVGAKLVPSLL